MEVVSPATKFIWCRLYALLPKSIYINGTGMVVLRMKECTSTACLKGITYARTITFVSVYERIGN